MSTIERIAARLGYVKRVAATPPLLRSTGQADLWTMPDGSLAETQEELYQRLSWVHAAVTIVAEACAGAAFSVKRLQDEKLVDVPNHPFERLLARPNPLQSRFELLMATAAFRQLTGNAIWWLNRSGPDAPPAEIWVLPSHQVKPVPDGRLFLKGYLYEPGPGLEPIALQPWEVVHFRRFHPRNWFWGLSPVEAIATAAVGDMKAAEWNTNYFGKHNAKLPGVLAFADEVVEKSWERLKADVKREWGGTMRTGPLMLRGVGKGGVEWVATTLNQKDMEFLSGRRFTKEEIFAVFAPGLSSMIGVEATEANSRTGKTTLMELAVWPLLVSMAEKISNDLLAVYGGDLVGAFDDVRATDRAMTLNEQQAYATVHTVDEVRERYYQDKPIGDGRGRLLPAEVGKSLTVGVEGGGKGEEGKRVRGPGQPARSNTTAKEERAWGASTKGDHEAREGGEDGGLKRAPQEGGAVVDELRRWRRKCVKRGKGVDFESEVIPGWVREAVKARLGEDAGSAFDPWLKADVADLEDGLLAAPAEVFAEIVDRMENEIAQWGPAAQVPYDFYGRLMALLLDWVKRAFTVGAIDKAMRVGRELAYTALGAAVAEQVPAIVESMMSFIRQTDWRRVAQIAAMAARQQEAERRAGLEALWSEVRARMIAADGISRALSEAVQWYVAQLWLQGDLADPVWESRHDKLVCLQCKVLDGEGERVWRYTAPNGPPAHVSCRCRLRIVMGGPGTRGTAG